MHRLTSCQGRRQHTADGLRRNIGYQVESTCSRVTGKLNAVHRGGWRVVGNGRCDIELEHAGRRVAGAVFRHHINIVHGTGGKAAQGKTEIIRRGIQNLIARGVREASAGVLPVDNLCCGRCAGSVRYYHVVKGAGFGHATANGETAGGSVADSRCLVKGRGNIIGDRQRDDFFIAGTTIVGNAQAYRVQSCRHPGWVVSP